MIFSHHIYIFRFFIIIFNYDWYFSFICFIHFRIDLYNLPGHPLISAIVDGFTRAKDVISITVILLMPLRNFIILLLPETVPVQCSEDALDDPLPAVWWKVADSLTLIHK